MCLSADPNSFVTNYIDFKKKSNGPLLLIIRRYLLRQDTQQIAQGTRHLPPPLLQQPQRTRIPTQILIAKMEGLKLTAECKSESGLDVAAILQIYENIRRCGLDVELLNTFVSFQRFRGKPSTASTRSRTSKSSSNQPTK